MYMESLLYILLVNAGIEMVLFFSLPKKLFIVFCFWSTFHFFHNQPGKERRLLRIWYYSKVWGPYTKPTLPFVSYSKDVHKGERSCFQQIHNLNKLIKYDTELSLLSTLLCIEVKNVKAGMYLPFLRPCHCLLNVYDSKIWE